METLKDYQQAAITLREKFKALNITATISAPRGEVENMGDKPWPHVAFDVEFAKGRTSRKVTWRMGVGCVKPINPDKNPSTVRSLSADGESILRAWFKNPHADFKRKDLQATVAAALARVQKVSPDPSEVFARVCSEALEATETTFDNWAANFGYDTDSRKAEKTFNQCREPYPVLLALCGSVETLREFAELSNQL